jgi:fibronectin type 3 domain-containing protein
MRLSLHIGRTSSSLESRWGIRRSAVAGLAVLLFAVTSVFVTATPASAASITTPTIGVATAGNGSANVTWSASTPETGCAYINRYRVTSVPATGNHDVTATAPGIATSLSITGLTNGTPYTFKVVARDSCFHSSGSSAASNSVTPNVVPGAPTGVTPTRGAGQVSLTWTAPAANGGTAITNYSVTPFIGATAQTAILTGSTSASYTVTGLTNGTAYTFKVAAINAGGTGSSSTASASVTPATVPGAPTIGAATRGDTQVAVAWTAPASNGGDAITTYTVTSAGGIAGPKTCLATAPALTCTVSGLVNGTAYTFTVTATNTVGTGPASASSASATPNLVPGAPTGVTPTRGNTQVSLTWTAPVSNGGTAITGYSVTPFIGATAQTAILTGSTSPSFMVTGLTNGTAYTFQVAAINAGGTGLAGTSASVTPATLPGAPTIGAATRGDTQVAVAWTAPASNGGDAITTYTVTSVGGIAGPKTCTATAPALTCTVSGLVNGTAYTFTVTATNTVGTGPASASSASATPDVVPGAPTGVTPTRGNTQVSLTWTAPVSNGGTAITGYSVTPFIGATPQTAILTGSTAASYTVTGLTNGTAYTFTVAAINAAGTGSSSSASASVTPATLPGAPTIGTATRGNTQVAVTWTAPASNGGDAITGYTVTSSPGGFTCTTASLSCTVTDLTNGAAYTFTVTATNTVGTGPASAASAAATPATVPGPPTGVTPTRDNTQVSVTWTAPASDGGSAISSYLVTSSPGSFTCTTASLSCTVTGLTNGTAYTFTVSATNATGSGISSAASASVTPATLPGAPTIGTATHGNTQVAVTWTAPASNGGDAITGYTVTSSPGGFTCTTASLTCTVSGLTNGTAYTFTVTATNTVGTGSAPSP